MEEQTHDELIDSLTANQRKAYDHVMKRLVNRPAAIGVTPETKSIGSQFRIRGASLRAFKKLESLGLITIIATSYTSGWGREVVFKPSKLVAEIAAATRTLMRINFDLECALREQAEISLVLHLHKISGYDIELIEVTLDKDDDGEYTARYIMLNIERDGHNFTSGWLTLYVEDEHSPWKVSTVGSILTVSDFDKAMKANQAAVAIMNHKPTS